MAINKIKIPGSADSYDVGVKVQSVASTGNGNYPIILNNGTSATTNTVLINTNAYVNPSTGNLGITKINGVTVGSSPKFTDTTYSVATSSANGLLSSTDKIKYDGYQAAINNLRDYIDTLYAKMGSNLASVQVDGMNIGTTVYIIEDGVPTPFIVAHKNYISSGNVVLVRKYPLPLTQYHTAGTVNSYGLSNVDTYLTGTYSSSLTGVTLSPINIPLYPANNTSASLSTLSRSVFLPSITEVNGATHPRWSGSEGSILSYFSTNTTDRVPMLSANQTSRVPSPTRSMYNTSYFYSVISSGQSDYNVQGSINPRPCVCVTNTSNVYVVNIITNTMVTASV